MDITFLTEYTMPVVVGLCLCVGYIIKHWLKDADNKIIPTVVTVVGIAANMDFLLVCTYEENGENPELVIYKKR